MDDETAERARQRQGVVTRQDLGRRVGRDVRRHGLVPVQPRAYVAATQPVDVDVLAAAVRSSVRGRYAFLGRGALWLHGAVERPDVLVVGVPHSTRLRLAPPVVVSRVSPAVLSRVRTRHGLPVVDVEMALLQACAKRPHVEAVALLETVLRERRTTVPRLRERCGRGIDGSAAVRAAADELVGGNLDKAVRLLRRALEARGVTGLQTEVRFVSEGGAHCYGDLYDPYSRTLLELDGFLTHAVLERFRADRRRDRWMRREHDVGTLRIDAGEVFTALEPLADEVADILLTQRALAATTR